MILSSSQTIPRKIEIEIEINHRFSNSKNKILDMNHKRPPKENNNHNNNMCVVLLFLFVSLLFNNINLTRADLTVSELKSIEWVTKQYKLKLPFDQSICNGTYSTMVTCVTDQTTGITNIKRIEMITGNTISGDPDPNLLQFDFPKLEYYQSYSDTGPQNASLNSLVLLKNLPLLSEILQFTNAYLKSIPTFFNNSVASLISISGRLNYIGIDPSIHLPNIKTLILQIQPLSPFVINVGTNSFPSLTGLNLNINSASKLQVIINSLNISNLLISAQDSAPMEFILGDNCDNLQDIQLLGYFNFSSVDLSKYKNLRTMRFDSELLSELPFSRFPQATTSLVIQNNVKLVFSNQLIPPNSMTVLEIRNCSMSNFPLVNFANQKDFHLRLLNSPNLYIGDVPQQWCQFLIVMVKNVGQIGTIPDCFYCYAGDGNPNIDFPLTVPPGFVCNVTFDSFNLVSKNRVYSVHGNNLGWGYPIGSPAIPNKQIIYTSTFKTGPPYPVSIPFAGKNYTFTLVEAGYILNSVGVRLKTVGDPELYIRLFRNTYLNYTITITQKNISCNVIGHTADSITCTFPKDTLLLPLSPFFYFNIKNDYLDHTLTSIFDYPTVTSVNYTIEGRILKLYGNYGSPATISLEPVIVKVSDSIDCIVNNAFITLIQCTLSSVPPPGPATLFVSVNGSEFLSSSLLNFGPANNNNGTSAQDLCKEQTFNCYGHGQCDQNGICQCNENYNQIDNCLTKFANTTIKPNTTNPTVNFDIDGIDFDFEIYSIQEINYDGQLIKELSLSSEIWNVSINSDNITTFANYQLDTNNIVSNNSMYQFLLVSSDISFSLITRNITFGGTQLILLPNAIKVGFTIKYWPYQSNVATLRVVFKSIINNDQSILFDCEKQSINSFTKDKLSESIQYLRVVKDNIQFNGRFIDFVVSDGRKTYSKTELISQTLIDNSDDQSIVLIGINIPQCQSCQLDPDFTPLIIDKSSNQTF
ncbi:EGF-like domain-containing protein [Cavenderia fasciculata]|uniref:EGF-like domain-containing protein n=1 Tax=Cavenderia fasciculata TaxID=261658 RepID=F4Q4G5_CACFS|nr:EGF-like domain-containing protein [Cavenderia fasciculata]EGG17814.1 EGF-like domain-containing protein [Cavenderia fasciculata]|eukprot:XP_004356298.1 EGF-like domain-containing protein [Cavenderia fasciculata]